MKTIRGLMAMIIAVAVLSASALSVCAIGFEAEVAYDSVFVIHSGNSLGSGFAIGENCIVTNAHVVGDGKQVTITAYDGTEYQASVYGIDQEEDIAVLVVGDATFPYLKLADLSAMKTGDDIYAIGAPKGMAYTLTKGGISSKERSIGTRTYIQIDAPINEGNSGGPLLNDAGEVLGMNTLKMSDSEGIGLAIPVTRVCEYLESLGIELDSNGNVAQVVDSEQGNAPVTDNEKGKTGLEVVNLPTATLIAFIVAGVSLMGNVLLVVLLIYQKKKNINLKYDPKERTDFDIDVWE